jgi:integrase
LLPSLSSSLARAITVTDVADLVERLRSEGRSERTIQSALHTLNSIMRFALRSAWIAENPLEKLERDERPHPVRPTRRVLGQQEIALLLGACTAASRIPIATALYTGLRISELLGLIWSDLDCAKALFTCARSSREPATAAPRGA